MRGFYNHFVVILSDRNRLSSTVSTWIDPVGSTMFIWEVFTCIDLVGSIMFICSEYISRRVSRVVCLASCVSLASCVLHIWIFRRVGYIWIFASDVLHYLTSGSSVELDISGSLHCVFYTTSHLDSQRSCI